MELLLTGIGGATIGRLSPLLAHGARVVVYGGMNGEPVTIPTRHLTYDAVTLHGFWLASTPAETVAAAYRRTADLIADGTLHAPVAATYRIEDYAKAVEHAERGARDGKVLFTF